MPFLPERRALPFRARELRPADFFRVVDFAALFLRVVFFTPDFLRVVFFFDAFLLAALLLRFAAM